MYVSMYVHIYLGWILRAVSNMPVKERACFLSPHRAVSKVRGLRAMLLCSAIMPAKLWDVCIILIEEAQL